MTFESLPVPDIDVVKGKCMVKYVITIEGLSQTLLIFRLSQTNTDILVLLQTDLTNSIYW